MAARLKFRFKKLGILKKITAARKWLIRKRSSSKKAAAPKSNCYVEVVTLKKCEEEASPKIKLSWKSRKICEKGNRHLKKISQIKLVITFNWNYFPESFPHPGKYAWGISREYFSGFSEQTEIEINRSCLFHTIIRNFLSCMYHKQKNCLDSYCLCLIFLLRGLFLLLIQ